MKIFKATKSLVPCDGHDQGEIMLYNGKLFVSTRDCWLQIDELQLSGKKRMDAKTFLNGYRGIEGCKVK